MGKCTSGGVKGRLKSHYESVLGTSQFVTSMIREGCRLHCSEHTTPCFLKNNRSAHEHPEFVVKATEQPLCNNCIVEHDFSPYCVNHLW